MTLPAPARDAIGALLEIDPDFAGIEAAAGPLPWRTRPAGFPGLLQAIVGQQISTAAAAAIWGRLAAIPGALDPATLHAMTDDALRAPGLSRPKVAHARSLAAAFLDGRLDTASLAAMPDAQAITTLSAVRGLGRWTAEIYLLFALQRMDVFPSGDIALAASVADLKALSARPTPVALDRMALAWTPHRAIAARLLWHHWRFRTGRPTMDDLPAASSPATMQAVASNTVA